MATISRQTERWEQIGTLVIAINVQVTTTPITADSFVRYAGIAIVTPTALTGTVLLEGLISETADYTVETSFQPINSAGSDITLTADKIIVIPTEQLAVPAIAAISSSNEAAARTFTVFGIRPASNS